MYVEGFLGTLGGLSLFIYGMKILNSVLESMGSNRLKNVLHIASKNKVGGAAVGTLVSGFIQSSSGTTVMIVGLVNAGILSLRGAVPLIMGANIGTTVTAQIIAFKITKYAPIALFIATFSLLFLKRNSRLKKLGELTAGIAMIFFGMEIMSKSISFLHTSVRFNNIVSEIGDNWLLGLISGMCLTAIIQSSGSGVALVQAMTANRLLTLPMAIPILLGQNIGTCSTALLASIGGSRRGVQAALIHFMFNAIGTLMFLPFISLLASLVTYLEPTNSIRQIAHAHTLFNVISTVVLLPFSNFFAVAATKITSRRGL